MASKIFLDANLLLDFTLKRDGYNEAKQVLDFVIAGQAQAFTTSSVIHITGHYLTKFYGSDKTKELLLTILIDVSIIDISHETAIVALSSKFKDIEDSLQYYTAIHHKLDYFISNDKGLKKDGIPILPVYTPKEFIAEFA
jgi:predicted nucleic acid-binding protein